MPNYLETLIDRIEDDSLRDALRGEIEQLRENKKFGLVFERHLPETVRLQSHPVRKGTTVQKRDEEQGPIWTVASIRKGKATIVREVGDETLEETCEATDLIVVRIFGQPIYPGLKSVGRVERGGDKPFHAVLNAENFHALETLLYAYEGKVDCIYIDPPYNTGAKDWKYNNDYVDGNDAYRHSKWLSFMEKRLRLAKRLLNSSDSVLIATIDEKEVLRLGLLLESVFPECTIQMVSCVINPKGTARYNEFSRVDEYIFFVFIGEAKLHFGASDMLTSRDYSEETDVRWRGLARTGRKGLRGNNPGSFYPIFLEKQSGKIHSIGETLPIGKPQGGVKVPRGTIAVWPPSTDGQEYSWSVVPDTLREIQKQGGLKTGRIDFAKGSFPFYYISSGTFQKIQTGEITVVGRGVQGELVLEHATRTVAPRTVWNQVAHDAGSHGTGLLQKLVPGRRFPFPKSLYVVEDCLRFVLKQKQDAVVIDFFGGSGTTAHAVARLNRQDGGQRHSIVITNNEVGPEEAKKLSDRGLRPGDADWERLGIAQYITWPRVSAAISGITHDGQPIEGDYKFVDEFPMSEGFEENVEFFELTYQDRDMVSLGRAFEAVAPLLWLKAGGRGARIEKLTKDGAWSIPDDAFYGILFDPQEWRAFANAVGKREDVAHVYVVTDSASVFQQVISELPAAVPATWLYEDYLTSFAINTSGVE